jgi:hypothetical protein
MRFWPLLSHLAGQKAPADPPQAGTFFYSAIIN